MRSVAWPPTWCRVRGRRTCASRPRAVHGLDRRDRRRRFSLVTRSRPLPWSFPFTATRARTSTASCSKPHGRIRLVSVPVSVSIPVGGQLVDDRDVQDDDQEGPQRVRPGTRRSALRLLSGSSGRRRSLRRGRARESLQPLRLFKRDDTPDCSGDHLRSEPSGWGGDAFVTYRDMGRDRNTRRVARLLKKSHTLIGRWSSVHDWPCRAAALGSRTGSAQTGHAAR